MSAAEAIDFSRDLGRISRGELLVVWRYRTPSKSDRRRGRAGAFTSQPEAAKAFAIGYSAYRRLEVDRKTKVTGKQLAAIERTIKSISPTTGELCLIARRRSRRLLFGLQRELRVSRPTFHEMERRGHPAIVRLWERAGFAFP